MKFSPDVPITPTEAHPELHSVDEAPALVTLVTTSFGVAAVGTDAFYETVSQETLAVLTAQLLHQVFQQVTTLVESPENVLGNPVRIPKEIDREDQH